MIAVYLTFSHYTPRHCIYTLIHHVGVLFLQTRQQRTELSQDCHKTKGPVARSFRTGENNWRLDAGDYHYPAVAAMWLVICAWLLSNNVCVIWWYMKDPLHYLDAWLGCDSRSLLSTYQ